MEAGNHQVLLLFKKGGSTAIQSPHDGSGELHLAFAIAVERLAEWEAWLSENGIAVEEKRKWDLGGQSIYFRDPDRHLPSGHEKIQTGIGLALEVKTNPHHHHEVTGDYDDIDDREVG